MSRCEGNDDQKPDPHGRVRQSYEVRHPTGQRQVTRGQSSVKPHAAAARFQAAIDHLSALLQSTVAAEELAISWHGNHSPSDSVTGKQQQMGLADLKRLLDSGRRVNGAQGRGIPTWIVVRTVKASWHHDGSWPLVGSDEGIQAAANLALASLPQSVHSSRLLLRPRDQHRAQGPLVPDYELEKGLPPQRPDPEPQEMAERYAARGIDVGPALRGSGAFDD